MTDLINEVGIRTIENLSLQEIKQALDNAEYKSARGHGGGLIISSKDNLPVFIQCVKAYFEPEKSYYHLNENSTCPFVQNALGIKDNINLSCAFCLQSCIVHNLKVKKTKNIIQSAYIDEE